MASCIRSGSWPYKDGIPAVTPHQALKLFPGDAGQNGWICDLVSVQMEDRQDRPVGAGIEKFICMQSGCKGTGFGLSIPDNACNDKRGIIENRPKSVAQRIAQLAAFVNRPRAFRRSVAGDT